MPDDATPTPIPTWVLVAAVVVDLGILFAGLLTGSIILTVFGAMALVMGVFVVLKVAPAAGRQDPTAPPDQPSK